MKKKEKIREPGISAEKKDNLKCYFSLLTQKDNVTWFKAGGFSMLPLFWPGCRVRMNTDFDLLEVGMVVVFPDGKKLIAHRIVARGPEGNIWLTKGDSLYFFDQQLDEADILGVVDFIDQYGKQLWVGSDPAVAGLSADLGRRLEQGWNWLPAFLKKVYYYTIFFPVFVFIQLKKKV